MVGLAVLVMLKPGWTRVIVASAVPVTGAELYWAEPFAVFLNEPVVTSLAVVARVVVQVIEAPTARLAGKAPPQLRALMPASRSVRAGLVRATLPSLVSLIV